MNDGHDALLKALGDSNAFVRIAAAEALARYGKPEDLQPALAVLIEESNAETAGNFEAMAALNAIDILDEKAGSLADQVKQLPRQTESAKPRTGGYVGQLLDHLNSDSDE